MGVAGSRTEPEVGIAESRALGCAVRVVVTDPRAVVEAKAAVDAVLRDIDDSCSRFRPDSELSGLNSTPGRKVSVSPLLGRALDVALRAAELSAGAVDPTVGAALKLAGYDRDFAALPAEGGAIRLVAVPVVGWQHVAFDRARGTVWVPAGVEIDLGATAKALATDMAADAALAVAGGGVMVSVGGDIATRGEIPPGGWQVQVSEDSGEAIYDAAEAIRIWECGVATSSTTVRRWTRGGISLHHIIDPVTGLPAGGPWRTATVVAATCVDANTASTAAIVLGEAAIEWLEASGLPARLVDHSGAVSRLAGWPQLIESPSR